MTEQPTSLPPPPPTPPTPASNFVNNNKYLKYAVDDLIELNVDFPDVDEHT